MKYKIIGINGEYLFSTKFFKKLQNKCLDWYNKEPKNLTEAIKIIEESKHYLHTN